MLVLEILNFEFSTVPPRASIFLWIKGWYIGGILSSALGLLKKKIEKDSKTVCIIKGLWNNFKPEYTSSLIALGII